jgi:hypothetical protein
MQEINTTAREDMGRFKGHSYYLTDLWKIPCDVETVEVGWTLFLRNPNDHRTFVVFQNTRWCVIVTVSGAVEGVGSGTQRSDGRGCPDPVSRYRLGRIVVWRSHGQMPVEDGVLGRKCLSRTPEGV